MKLNELLNENQLPMAPISLEHGVLMDTDDGIATLEDMDGHGVFEVNFSPDYTGHVAVKVTHYTAGAPMMVSRSRGAGFGDAEPPEPEEIEWEVIGAFVSTDDDGEQGRLFTSWKECPLDLEESSSDDITESLIKKAGTRNDDYDGY